MSERGSGFGPFLVGLGIGAVLGFLFAPEPGAAARAKLSRKLRGLRDLAEEKAGELLGAAAPAGDEGEAEAPARAVLARRLAEAKRRRRGGAAEEPAGEGGEPPA